MAVSHIGDIVHNGDRFVREDFWVVMADTTIIVPFWFD